MLSLRSHYRNVDLEYPKQLQELHNDYPLAPDKIEIKRQILSHHQLKIADLYNIPVWTVKKLVPNFYDSLWKVETLLEARIKNKKIHRELEFNHSQWLKQYLEFNTQKRIEAEKMMKKMEKVAKINEQCCI